MKALLLLVISFFSATASGLETIELVGKQISEQLHRKADISDQEVSIDACNAWLKHALVVAYHRDRQENIDMFVPILNEYKGTAHGEYLLTLVTGIYFSDKTMQQIYESTYPNCIKSAKMRAGIAGDDRSPLSQLIANDAIDMVCRKAGATASISALRKEQGGHGYEIYDAGVSYAKSIGLNDEIASYIVTHVHQSVDNEEVTAQRMILKCQAEMLMKNEHSVYYKNE